MPVTRRSGLDGRTRQPSGEVHVVLRLEPPHLDLESLQLAIDDRRASSTSASARQQKPDQRQPQLARVRHGPAVDEHLARVERGRRAETGRAAPRHRSSGTSRDADASAGCPTSGTRATRGRVSSARWKSVAVERRKYQRDRERPGRPPNSAACRSGSSAASSSGLGSSDSSAYGQNRSRGCVAGIAVAGGTNGGTCCGRLLRHRTGGCGESRNGILPHLRLQACPTFASFRPSTSCDSDRRLQALLVGYGDDAVLEALRPRPRRFARAVGAAAHTSAATRRGRCRCDRDAARRRVSPAR